MCWSYKYQTIWDPSFMILIRFSIMRRPKMSITNLKNFNFFYQRIENWRIHLPSSKYKSTTPLQRYQTLSQENDEQCYWSNNFEWKIQRWRRTIATYPNYIDRYVIRIQMFAIPDATRFCNDNQQSTRAIVANVWIKCFSHGHSGVVKSSDLFVNALSGNTLQ